MVFDIGKLFIIPANTKIWLIPIQRVIQLDEDLVCSLIGWGHQKDIIFGHGVYVPTYFGWSINPKFEINISVNKVYPVEIVSEFDGYLFVNKIVRL